MEYIKFIGNGEDDMPDHTHLSGALGTDYTLCGVTLDSDPETAGSWEHVEAKKLTCPECVAIVKACRNKAIKI